MRKNRKNIMYLLFLSIILVLAACTNEPSPEQESYIAKESDLKDNFYTSNEGHRIGVWGSKLRIAGIYNKEAKRKSSLDEILAAINEELETDQIEKDFSNVEIKTENDKYYITADEGISLTFTKVGESIIEDENGIEYSKNK